jgi:hypothetical protein
LCKFHRYPPVAVADVVYIFVVYSLRAPTHGNAPDADYAASKLEWSIALARTTQPQKLGRSLFCGLPVSGRQR